MPHLADFFPLLCDVWTGDFSLPQSVRIANVPCNVVPLLHRQSSPLQFDLSNLYWTHYVVVNASVDIHDAYLSVFPPSGQSQSDWLEIPPGSGKFLVVGVMTVCFAGTPQVYKKCYCNKRGFDDQDWSFVP
jgi:hypothetical protein